MKPEDELGAGEVGSTNSRAIAAFCVGIVAGVALTIGVQILGRAAMERLELGDNRPRRMRIGNLEIEERGPGHEARFHVQ